MKMTKTLTTLVLLTSLCFSSLISAEEVVIPVVTKPSILQEGTQRELSPAQIEELIPWAKNSKVFLNDLLNSLQGLSSVDKLDRLEVGIESVVGESAPKNSELLMRYVLNRGLVINDLLKKEIAAEEVGSIDTKLRVLISSINMAITYYDTDMSTLAKKTSAPFIAFGVSYFQFLSELNKSIFDASASYNVQRTALEWLQWDLYRDLNNQQVASQIVKINNSLKMFPTKSMSDAQYITYIKQMKLMVSQLDLKDGKVKISRQREIQENVNSSYTTECLEVMSSDSYKTACMNIAKSSNVAPSLIKVCGKIMSSDSYTYDCIGKMPGNFDQDIINSYLKCGTIMSSESYALACVDLVTSYSTQTIDVEQCGLSMRSDSYRYDCIQKIGQSGMENLADITKECASTMSSESYRLACLGHGVRYKLERSDVRACKKLSSDSYKYDCLEKIGVANRVGDSEEEVAACSSIMRSDSYAVACISIAFSKSSSSKDIRACNQVYGDSNRYDCLSNL